MALAQVPTRTLPVSTHCCQITRAVPRQLRTHRFVPREVSQPRSIRHRRRSSPSTLRASLGPSQGVGLSEELHAAIDKFIADNKIVLFMKGNRMFPQCGFSNTCVQILNTLGVPYETVNILEDELLRSGMKEYSQWPTFPQVYIDGEFYGGCDIMIESYTNGELKEHLEAALNS